MVVASYIDYDWEGFAEVTRGASSQLAEKSHMVQFLLQTVPRGGPTKDAELGSGEAVSLEIQAVRTHQLDSIGRTEVKQGQGKEEWSFPRPRASHSPITSHALG